MLLYLLQDRMVVEYPVSIRIFAGEALLMAIDVEAGAPGDSGMGGAWGVFFLCFVGGVGDGWGSS